MIIRKAELKDLEELLNIYNYEVVNGTATFDIVPKNLAEWQAWFQNHNSTHHPLYVAEIDNHIGGYVTLSSYREKEAYNSTVELSLYVSPDYRQRGVASRLMEFAIQLAKEDEQIHTIISVITSNNQISILLHQKYGFKYCGTIHEVGFKMGNYLDVDNYQLIIHERNTIQ